METYLNRFKSLNAWYCIVVILLLSYLVILPLAAANYFFPSLVLGENGAISKTNSLFEKIFMAVVIAPPLETFLYQWLPSKVLLQKYKFHWLYTFLLSVITFSTSHPYSLGYIIFSALIGSVLIFGYILLIETNKSPFKVIMCAHALRNSIALFIIWFNHH